MTDTFGIGDIVEMKAAPGHRMVVDLDPKDSSMPRPCVKTAWKDGNGKVQEGTIECRNLRLVKKARA